MLPVLKNIPVRRVKQGRSSEPHLLRTSSPPHLRTMSLNLEERNPFLSPGPAQEEWAGAANERSLLDGGAPRDRNPFDDEEDENTANEGRCRGDGGGGSAGKRALRGTLDRLRGASPLKTLGKLGKGLRMSGGRSHKANGATPPSPPGSLGGGGGATPSPSQKKKKGRRSSEGSLLRFAGKCRESLRMEGSTNGEQACSESEGDASSRRLSFMKMVGLGRKRESLATDHASSQAPEDHAEEEEEQEEEQVKPREPLSVLEILQLVTRRDLLLADAHILELEQECNEAAAAVAAATLTSSSSSPAAAPEDVASPGNKDGGRRKAKDVELLYEALQKELWDVVRESLRSPTAGPNLGLVVQVLQQEEQADRAWAQSEGAVPGGPRPRELRRRWREAVAAAADGSLPPRGEAQEGELASYLDRIRTRVVEDLGAAKRNVVPVYPEEDHAFQVYAQSYHQAVSKRLRVITERPLHASDIYAMLDWLYNIYNRDVLGAVSMTTPFDHAQLGPLLPAETVDKLELDCLNSVRAKVTTELSQLLEEEGRRWTETLHIEEFQISLACTVIQRLQVDLERSAAISRELGSRVAQVSLNGLADFLYSFQRKAEMFHELLVNGAGANEDGYVSKTIALVNCCPPFTSFVQRCVQCDPAVNVDSARRANTALDRITNQGVKVLSDRLYEHIRPFFDRLVKRRWLSNTEAFDQISAGIKEHFKKFRRMDNPPYQLLVGDTHRRVLVEYLRSIMRGRVLCTSMKMRKRMSGRLRDEAKQIKTLFCDLDSPCSWLDSAVPHLAEIIVLEDTPSIQVEVGVLVREFPDIRKKHISAILNIRGMTRQAERQEVLNVVRDLEGSEVLTRLTPERGLFHAVPVTSEAHCLNRGLSRLALSASACLSGLRPRPRKRHAPVATAPGDDEL